LFASFLKFFQGHFASLMSREATMLQGRREVRLLRLSLVRQAAPNRCMLLGAGNSDMSEFTRTLAASQPAVAIQRRE
jgi:hypothetical protein